MTNGERISTPSISCSLNTSRLELTAELYDVFSVDSTFNSFLFIIAKPPHFISHLRTNQYVFTD
jgi:hypothetical protein